MNDIVRVGKHILRRARYGIPEALLGPNEVRLKRLIKSGRVTLGRHTYGVPEVRTFVYDDTRLHVGKYCSLGGTYLLGGQHGSRTVSTYPHRINWHLEGAGQDGIPVPTGDTHVGSDVWTGYGCWILSGVKIGNGAIVATGAVVTKDVPDYAIVGGIPAKVIAYRHTEEQRAALLEMKWWDWPDEDVLEAVPYLASEDIDAFIEFARTKGRLGTAASTGG